MPKYRWGLKAVQDPRDPDYVHFYMVDRENVVGDKLVFTMHIDDVANVCPELLHAPAISGSKGAEAELTIPDDTK